MGFGLEIAAGPSIALKANASTAASPPRHVSTSKRLLAVKPADRANGSRSKPTQTLTGEGRDSAEGRQPPEDLLAALEKKIDRQATPHSCPAAAMVLQPTDERRRSGSHYTPRSLTEPIVATTLEPILRATRRDARRPSRSSI